MSGEYALFTRSLFSWMFLFCLWFFFFATALEPRVCTLFNRSLPCAELTFIDWYRSFLPCVDLIMDFATTCTLQGSCESAQTRRTRCSSNSSMLGCGGTSGEWTFSSIRRCVDRFLFSYTNTPTAGSCGQVAYGARQVSVGNASTDGVGAGQGGLCVCVCVCGAGGPQKQNHPHVLVDRMLWPSRTRRLTSSGCSCTRTCPTSSQTLTTSPSPAAT